MIENVETKPLSALTFGEPVMLHMGGTRFDKGYFLGYDEGKYIGTARFYVPWAHGLLAESRTYSPDHIMTLA